MTDAPDDPGRLIRDRRLEQGLSQAAVAKALGTHKSLISMVEAGRRTLTATQIDRLAELLELPEDLVRIALGRLPDDVEAAVAARTGLVTTSVREATESDATGFPTAPSEAMQAILSRPVSDRPANPRNPFVGPIRTGKNTTSYRTHSYHTKVPPAAIVPLIEHHTRPLGVVLDPFCGSGMTGVAALECGRNALLSDLSPAAVHIARNYVTPCDPVKLRLALQRLEHAVVPTMSYLYDVRAGLERRTIEHTVWSDRFECPSCQAQFSWWAVARASGGLPAGGEVLACPACARDVRKQDLRWLSEEPVETVTSSSGGERDRHAPTAAELALIAHATEQPIPYWTPRARFETHREMWRASHAAMGIDSAAGFYTRRNLHALAILRHAILQEPDPRLRDALLFAFTGCVNRASRRYQWNAKRPTNVMTGTLYISSLRYEWNVWRLFSRKANDVVRYYAGLPRTDARAEALLADATDLGFVADGAVDFVFMDPPFGANIYYADSSLLWEAWLGRTTDQRRELVINQRLSKGLGGKSLDDYGTMLEQAFSEVRRILRPGGAAVLAFANTDDDVWQRIQSAIAAAGLEVAQTAVLDKVQNSIKGIQANLGHERVGRLDLLLSLRPIGTRARTADAPKLAGVDRDELASELRAQVAAAGAAGIAIDAAHAAILQRLLVANRPIAGVSYASVEELLATLAVLGDDGRFRIGGNRSHGYHDVGSPHGCLVDEYLRSAPVVGLEPTGRPKRVATALTGVVLGSRSTALYNAHSYHTKVPPEAIRPFIEHYTRPGDVVLDPFSGSGMTGVAAAQCGRRAILNDLAVVSAHLGYNHTRPCDPAALRAEFARLDAQLRPTFERLYATRHDSTTVGYGHYTIWSRFYRCQKCARRFSMWEVTNVVSGRVGRTVSCPQCGLEHGRQALEAAGNEPVAVSYEVQTEGRTHRVEKPFAADDRKRLAELGTEVGHWYPRVPIASTREMYIRSALHLRSVHTVADFYTPRNLQALALLWDTIQAVKDERIRHVLAFAFTNTAWHGTRMRRFNARGGQRPLTGTLYIPQLSIEVNVLEVMRNKIAQLAAYYEEYSPAPGVELPMLRVGSATDLAGIPDGSIDYVFTDPPFGSNIFYADCNLIWESWLGGITDDTLEAVVNRSRARSHGGKSTDDYRSLMTDALCEIQRVLKPGGWVTMVFHNTDPDVWRALQEAAAAAGFAIDDAASLDRKQQSHKGYKGRANAERVAHFDVVLSMRKIARHRRKRLERIDDDALRAAVVALAAADPRMRESAQWTHSVVVRYLLTNGYDLEDVSFDRVRQVWSKVVERS